MADPAPKPRSRTRAPLTVEEFAEKTDEVVRQIQHVSSYFTGNKKASYKLPEGSPGKNEWNTLVKRVVQLSALYRTMSKNKKAKKTKRKTKTGGTKNRGFKQERFLKQSAIKFVNEHGQLPEHLQIEVIKDAGGQGIWTIAQATQLMTWYVDENGLKNTGKRSEIMLDDALIDLFQDYFSELDAKSMWRVEGKIYVKHSTMQRLIPHLFERDLPVLQSMLTDETRKRLDDRETLFKKRTEENRLRRIDRAKAAKEAAATASDEN